MMSLYERVAHSCSELITKNYSTSFTLGIRMFHKRFRPPIYSLYGFVRFADEIVDTFHGFDKDTLINEFEEDTYKAIDRKISTNPVLQSFQQVVHTYQIDKELIDSFLKSMKMDLFFNTYKREKYEEYIYGSAEVVGLMCLRVFCEGDNAQYEKLKPYAMKLGAAFQKVNFLRDMKSDYDQRDRVYFPGIDFENFHDDQKRSIEVEIREDFVEAYKGIRQLPKGARFGVYLAYVYYNKLLKKIESTPTEDIKKKRLRVYDGKKAYLLLSSAVKNQLNLL